MEVLLAKERILKLIQAWVEKQIESWSLPALLLQLLNDSRTINEMLKQCEQTTNLSVQQEQEEQVAQSFTPNWNFSMINDDEEHSIQYKEYLENSSNASASVLPTEEPKYSLSMGIMSITKEQQQALDDALIPREQHLKIGSCNYRLSITFKTKEPTFQVALDVLSLTPLYPAFSITASRTFKTIINKCLSGKVAGIDTLRLSRAQILLGVKEEQIHVLPKIHQIHHQSLHVTRSINSKKKQDGLDMANDDPILTTMRFIPQHKVVQKKKKQITKGLETLSEIDLSEAEQMKLAIKRSKTQLHSSQPSSSSTLEGTGVTPTVPDVPTYKSNDEQISWKSSDDEDDDDDETSIMMMMTLFILNDEDSNEEIHGVNVEGDKLNGEETKEEDEGDELCRDVNVNLEGQDIEMTYAQQTNV
nr:hypothetical protein [Tanacetum cinerariifolium]